VAHHRALLPGEEVAAKLREVYTYEDSILPVQKIKGVLDYLTIDRRCVPNDDAVHAEDLFSVMGDDELVVLTRALRRFVDIGSSGEQREVAVVNISSLITLSKQPWRQ
jgi:hypothetical protein